MDHGIGDWVRRQAARNGHRNAYVDATSGAVTTYARLHERTDRLADALAADGVRRGDRVALLTLNSPQMMEVLLAVAKLGAISVPINFRLTAGEVAYVLADSGASVLFASGSLRPVADAAAAQSEAVRRIVTIPDAAQRAATGEGEYGDLLAAGSPDAPERDVAETDVAFLMYTSGTTGRPKGAMLTHRNCFFNVVNALGAGNGIGREDVTISAAPLFHIGALGIHTLPLTYLGAATVITESFDPDEWLELAARYRVTVAFLVPAMWGAVARALSGSRHDLSALAFAITGGAPCPLPVIRALREQGVRFTEGFGMTETSPDVAFLQPEHVEDHAGSIGRPVMHVDTRIVDAEDREVPVGSVGELCLRGPSIFAGYWNRPCETAEAMRGGWFHTGDMARVDDDGFITLVDRKKDMVITGGENVYPIEVEQVLYAHPDVLEVAVIGLPDEAWGERVTAVVVLSEGAEAGEDTLREWCRARLARYKAPREFRFVEALPRNATGKILKRTLRLEATGSAGQIHR